MGGYSPCTYPNCNQLISFPNDENLCVFHHKTNNEVTSEKYIELLIKEKIEKNDFEFEGFIFTHYLIWKDLVKEFTKPINFQKCIFKGKKEFDKENYCASFENMYLFQADFRNSRFYGSVNFKKVKFHDFVFFGEVEFINDKITKDGIEIRNIIDFSEANFEVRLANFFKIKCLNCNLHFNKIKYNQISWDQVIFGLSNGLLFNYSNFKNSNISFSSCTINTQLLCFDDSVFDMLCYLNFDAVQFKIHTITFNSILKSPRGFIIMNSNLSFLDFNISNSIFEGMVNIQRNEFTRYDNVNESKFYIRETEFKHFFNITNTNFNISLVRFENTKFFYFNDFKFTEFNSELEFKLCDFWGDSKFNKTKFIGESVLFEDVSFAANSFEFVETEFKCKTKFINCSVRVNTNILFSNIKFGENSLFHFDVFKQIQIGIGSDIKTNNKLIIFEYINFIPHRTIFEKIFIDSDETLSGPEITKLIIFRYCQLKDIYFINDNMTYFSFYKSIYDDSIFILCYWIDKRDTILKFIKYYRPNVIFEDVILDSLKNKTKIIFEEKVKLYQIKDLNYDELESMYRRFKTALDRSKNYWEAGWFYFNEYEMKRLNCVDNRKVEFKVINWFRSFILYSYKLFAGYGEKPFWSFLWFVLFIIFFATLHILNGIEKSGKTINYDVNISIKSIQEHFNFQDLLLFASDFLYSTLYTISRVLPIGFVDFEKVKISSLNTLDLLLLISNSLILIILIAFIGVGLKRYFRRF